MFKLEEHTIFLTLAGSQAHGTARQGSDVDVRGVCVAPLTVRVSLFKTFEQHEGELPPELAKQVIPRIKQHPTAAWGLGVKTECVICDVAKFLSLCAGANPNALEILFASEADWLVAAPAWRRLHDQRMQFLTRKVQQTFLGYAMAQLKKIKTHRSWLLNPPAKKPSREDFGLPAHGGTLSADDQNRIEQGIAEKVRSYGIDNVDLPKPARIALQERLDAFHRDTLFGHAGRRRRTPTGGSYRGPRHTLRRRVDVERREEVPGGAQAPGLVSNLAGSEKSVTRRARAQPRLRHQARHAPDSTHANGARGAPNR